MRYEGSVYRPPSEAYSLIIQLTIGCARNTCTFCAMFKDKSFRIRPLDDVVEDMKMARNYYGNQPVKRLFIADGDALIVKTADLLYILNKAKEIFPELERISAYAAPLDVLTKTDEELKILKDAGLDMIYIGGESGDDEVLTYVKKGATSQQIQDACLMLKKAKMIVSITFISGLGGKNRLEQHAINTAKLINAATPEYVGFLTLVLEHGTELFEQHRRGEFESLSPQEVLKEMRLFIENIDSEGTVFRSNHASNYIPLKGTFNKDNEMMLQQIAAAEKRGVFKSDMFRGV